MLHRIFFSACFSLLAPAAQSQDAASAANAFIKTLSENQQQASVFPFGSGEQFNFHFVPKERKGITLNEMNNAQKAAAIRLLKTGLSEKTFLQVQDIMQLEKVLKLLEKRKEEDHYRDTGNYHISIFGIPSANTNWGWRFEGHHVSFNFSFNKTKPVSGTPGFLGSNPAIVPEGVLKGEQVLKDETDMGYTLLTSLNKEQFAKALIAETAPADIISFNKRNALPEDTRGVGYAELQPQQQELLLQLIREYVGRYTRLFAADFFKEIQEAGLQQLHFAWAGSTEKGIGHPHYYRITGPTILIEYDNTQNNANHIHSVLRNLKHDFGNDILLEHYQKEHTNQAGL